MNWFKKTTKKPLNTGGQPSKFKLEFFTEGNKNEYLHDVLGITEERAQEMTENVINAMKADKRKHEVLDKLVRDSHHENEIVFYVMIVNAVEEKNKKHSTLLDLLSKLD
jgi:hypothetical protein